MRNPRDCSTRDSIFSRSPAMKQLSAMLVKSWTEGWRSSSCLDATSMQATLISCRLLLGTAYAYFAFLGLAGGLTMSGMIDNSTLAAEKTCSLFSGCWKKCEGWSFMHCTSQARSTANTGCSQTCTYCMI